MLFLKRGEFYCPPAEPLVAARANDRGHSILGTMSTFERGVFRTLGRHWMISESYMEQASGPSNVERNRERVCLYSQGAQLIFENAEALYNEAQTLGTAGSLARAAALHQISMEECAKIDMLGAYTVSLLMGHEVDDARIARIFREHRVKNYANAYNATTTEEEKEARARGDWKASSEAFKRFQAQFHREFNKIKNDGLYVDFQDGRFTSPKEAISEELAAAAMHINADFLQRGALFIRLFRRIETAPQKFAEFSHQFINRAKELRESGISDPEILTNRLFEEMESVYT
jgi:AbiV family abortive infection protein